MHNKTKTNTELPQTMRSRSILKGDPKMRKGLLFAQRTPFREKDFYFCEKDFYYG